MLCENCGKNNATAHIKTVVNGVVSEKHLCGYCASKEGYGNFNNNNLTGLLASMLGDALSLNSDTATVRCDCCKSSFSDIASSGKVGCPQCYKTFYNELLPYLKRVHGSTMHSGKIPNRASFAEAKSEDTVEDLRLKLNRLVREEKYEEAAVVRDEIRKIEGEKQ